MTGQAYYDLNAPTDSVAYAQLKQEINVKGAEYMFVQAAATIARGDVCVVSNTGTIVPMTTGNAGADPQDVVIPQFAMASGEYGWAPVGPFHLREDNATSFVVNTLTGSAADTKLYTHATAGLVSGTATTLIRGLSLTAANASGGNALRACVATSRLGVNQQ